MDRLHMPGAMQNWRSGSRTLAPSTPLPWGCPVCKIVFRDGENSLWCLIQRCPQTNQRAPTEQQQIQLGMKEEK